MKDNSRAMSSDRWLSCNYKQLSLKLKAHLRTEQNAAELQHLEVLLPNHYFMKRRRISKTEADRANR